jgi:predicted neutral ceramidase superfamily lipid hydrolase
LPQGEGVVTVGSQVVRYTVDDSTSVGFEVDAPDGWQPVGAAEVAGRVRDAIRPAVEAAREVLEKVKEAGPDTVSVKFGVKVSGKADWIVARAATEGSFEITLTWEPPDDAQDGPAA